MEQNIEEIAKLLTDMMNLAKTTGIVNAEDWEGVIKKHAAAIENLQDRMGVVEEDVAELKKHRVEDRKYIDELKKSRVEVIAELEKQLQDRDKVIAELKKQLQDHELAAESAST